MEAEAGLFRVVVNAEEQYSIWPVGKQNAPGWRNEGFVGSSENCLAHVGEVWIDMRPLSLRGEKSDQVWGTDPINSVGAQN